MGTRPRGRLAAARQLNATEYHLEITRDLAGGTPARVLAAHAGLSIARVKDAMHKGAVWLQRSGHTRRLRRHATPLSAGDGLHLYYNPEILALSAPATALIADEQEFSVWAKPPGMRSQGSKWGDHTTLYRWAEANLTPQRQAFIVHRLDRAARGLMLLAHSKRTAAAVSALFADGKIDKRYQAVVHGRLATVALPLLLDEPLDGRRAVTRVLQARYDEGANTCLLDVRIDTGRKHQIRRHLANAGLPVVGDRLYGGAGQDDADLQLAAVRLSFAHPETGADCAYVLPPRLGLSFASSSVDTQATVE